VNIPLQNRTDSISAGIESSMPSVFIPLLIVTVVAVVLPARIRETPARGGARDEIDGLKSPQRHIPRP
jgi:hypothetical protein